MSAVADKTFLIVVGAPRSGTTWLTTMLAAHPAVAAMDGPELTVFTRYAGTWLMNFQSEAKDMREGRWRQGLPTVWSEGELDAFLQDFVHDVYGRVLARNPGASHVIDKHPNYSNYLHVVDRYLPRCKVIHIIRDGREVAVSMMSVNRRVGHSPGEVRTAANEWHRCITNAQAYAPTLGRERYLEVRYEALMSDTEGELQRIMAFGGLTLDAASLRRIAEEHHISRKQLSRGDEGNNALRAIPGAIWRQRLSLRQRYIFHRMAGRLLERLGYARGAWWATSPLDRLLMLPYGLVARLVRSVKALRNIWSAPLEDQLP